MPRSPQLESLWVRGTRSSLQFESPWVRGMMGSPKWEMLGVTGIVVSPMRGNLCIEGKALSPSSQRDRIAHCHGQTEQTPATDQIPPAHQGSKQSLDPLANG